MSIDFTVATPTYNGEHRLPLVLERLQQQTGVEQINWEIIIIDNNSTDETAKVIQDYQANWSQIYTLKYYFESEQGAAFARQRAVREAKGPLVGFLDDDNLPDSHWVAAAYSFAQEHPQAGAYSGQIHGDFEVTPPADFEKIQAFLAIREHGSEPCLFEPDSLRLPPGAALVVRRQAWLESVPKRPLLTGKLPGAMVQGDDYEPLLYLHKAGWQIWYNPAMHTYHQIPHWRLERTYLLSLARGCGLATCQLRMINANNGQKPMIIAKTLVGNLRRIALYLIKYQGQIQTNLVAACELEFFWGSFISPFYFFQKSLQSIFLAQRDC